MKKHILRATIYIDLITDKRKSERKLFRKIQDAIKKVDDDLEIKGFCEFNEMMELEKIKDNLFIPKEKLYTYIEYPVRLSNEKKYKE